jgi:hypothetical protein
MANRTRNTLRQGRWRWLALAVAVLVISAVAVIAVVDETALRSRFELTASDALGMSVTIDGPVGIGVWPMPHFTAGEIRLEQRDAQLAEIESARLDVAIAPLFLGELRIRHLVLDGADVRLARDASGRFNFEPLAPHAARGGPLPGIAVAAASFSYRDEASGAHLQASGCDGRLSGLAASGGEGTGRLARLEADGELHCATVTWQDLELTDVGIEARGREGRVTLDPVTLTVFGGTGRGRLEAAFSADLPRWSLDFTLAGFDLEAALRALEPEARAEGKLDFSAELTAAGVGRDAIERSLEGTISLHGKGLTLHGTDLDERLADYDATRRFGLVDAGAVLLAGPVGLVVTKGRDFARVLRADRGSTEFREVVSEWIVDNGVAEAQDVAAATGKHRLAARGNLDFSAQRFDGFTIVLLDSRGCAVMEQAVSGSFSDPDIQEPGLIETLLGPWIELLQRGIDQFTDDECTVVYDGAVSPP